MPMLQVCTHHSVCIANTKSRDAMRKVYASGPTRHSCMSAAHGAIHPPPVGVALGLRNNFYKICTILYRDYYSPPLSIVQVSKTNKNKGGSTLRLLPPLITQQRCKIRQKRTFRKSTAQCLQKPQDGRKAETALFYPFFNPLFYTKLDVVLCKEQ